MNTVDTSTLTRASDSPPQFYQHFPRYTDTTASALRYDLSERERIEHVLARLPLNLHNSYLANMRRRRMTYEQRAARRSTYMRKLYTHCTAARVPAHTQAARRDVVNRKWTRLTAPLKRIRDAPVFNVTRCSAFCDAFVALVNDENTRRLSPTAAQSSAMRQRRHNSPTIAIGDDVCVMLMHVDDREPPTALRVPPDVFDVCVCRLMMGDDVTQSSVSWSHTVTSVEAVPGIVLASLMRFYSTSERTVRAVFPHMNVDDIEIVRAVEGLALSSLFDFYGYNRARARIEEAARGRPDIERHEFAVDEARRMAVDAAIDDRSDTDESASSVRDVVDASSTKRRRRRRSKSGSAKSHRVPRHTKSLLSASSDTMFGCGETSRRGIGKEAHPMLMLDRRQQFVMAVRFVGDDEYRYVSVNKHPMALAIELYEACQWLRTHERAPPEVRRLFRTDETTRSLYDRVVRRLTTSTTPSSWLDDPRHYRIEDAGNGGGGGGKVRTPVSAHAVIDTLVRAVVRRHTIRRTHDAAVGADVDAVVVPCRLEVQLIQQMRSIRLVMRDVWAIMALHHRPAPSLRGEFVSCMSPTFYRTMVRTDATNSTRCDGAGSGARPLVSYVRGMATALRRRGARGAVPPWLCALERLCDHVDTLDDVADRKVGETALEAWDRTFRISAFDRSQVEPLDVHTTIRQNAQVLEINSSIHDVPDVLLATERWRDTVPFSTDRIAVNDFYAVHSSDEYVFLVLFRQHHDIVQRSSMLHLSLHRRFVADTVLPLWPHIMQNYVHSSNYHVVDITKRTLVRMLCLRNPLATSSFGTDVTKDLRPVEAFRLLHRLLARVDDGTQLLELLMAPMREPERIEGAPTEDNDVLADVFRHQRAAWERRHQWRERARAAELQRRRACALNGATTTAATAATPTSFGRDDDAIASRIPVPRADDGIVPRTIAQRFRDGDVFDGIRAGSCTLIGAVVAHADVCDKHYITFVALEELFLFLHDERRADMLVARRRHHGAACLIKYLWEHRDEYMYSSPDIDTTHAWVMVPNDMLSAINDELWRRHGNGVMRTDDDDTTPPEVMSRRDSQGTWPAVIALYRLVADPDAMCDNTFALRVFMSIQTLRDVELSHVRGGRSGIAAVEHLRTLEPKLHAYNRYVEPATDVEARMMQHQTEARAVRRHGVFADELGAFERHGLEQLERMVRAVEELSWWPYRARYGDMYRESVVTEYERERAQLIRAQAQMQTAAVELERQQDALDAKHDVDLRVVAETARVQMVTAVSLAAAADAPTCVDASDGAVGSTRWHTPRALSARSIDRKRRRTQSELPDVRHGRRGRGEYAPPTTPRHHFRGHQTPCNYLMPSDHERGFLDASPVDRPVSDLPFSFGAADTRPLMCSEVFPMFHPEISTRVSNRGRVGNVVRGTATLRPFYGADPDFIEAVLTNAPLYVAVEQDRRLYAEVMHEADITREGFSVYIADDDGVVQRRRLAMPPPGSTEHAVHNDYESTPDRFEAATRKQVRRMVLEQRCVRDKWR